MNLKDFEKRLESILDGDEQGEWSFSCDFDDRPCIKLCNGFCEEFRKLKQQIINAAKNSSGNQLLDFCHFIGKEGYKINGYDDGQLNKVIEQFLNIQSAPVAQ